MKKLKQGLLLAVLLLLGAYVTIPLIKQQRENWRYDELNELYNSTGYDYLYTESIPDFDSNDLVMLGAFQDGDGYKLVTACVPAEGEPALYESPLFRAETGDPATEVWYGIGGIEANPQLILMLKEQNPRCRVLELDGAEHRNHGNLQDIPIDFSYTDLNGLPDSNNCVTVSPCSVENVELEFETGFNMIENNASDVLETSEKMDEVQQLYLKFPIDLTEALARTGW